MAGLKIGNRVVVVRQGRKIKYVILSAARQQIAARAHFDYNIAAATMDGVVCVAADNIVIPAVANDDMVLAAAHNKIIDSSGSVKSDALVTTSVRPVPGVTIVVSA